MALIPEDPKQRNALFVGILALAGLYLFNSWWRAPRIEQLTADETRLEDLERENRRAQVIATRGGAELEERMALYERHISQLEQLIPESEEVAALLNDLAFQARQAGLRLQLMEPETPEPGTYYTKQTYHIQVIGEYHDVGRFLARIASLSRIITPIDLDIQVFDDQQNLYDYEAPVLADFRIQTYVVPDRPPPAGPPVPPGGSQ
ncbi:MAG: hypothetical protein D6701_07135 [Gemmatimonadetes bacterium]|nr:MAG: hypothetical protein D6701_07135 [Gemmatimonadota bacterium]